MKPRLIAEPAALARLEIAEFVARDGNIAKAEEYLTSSLRVLEEFDERFMPVQAHPKLPHYVRQVQVPGFDGYVLWIAVTDEVIAMIAAFRPGLPTSQKLRRARLGMRET